MARAAPSQIRCGVTACISAGMGFTVAMLGSRGGGAGMAGRLCEYDDWRGAGSTAGPFFLTTALYRDQRAKAAPGHAFHVEHAFFAMGQARVGHDGGVHAVA